ncbi:MAG TPA: hypothetical protein VLF66_14615, partial [Thermoanaerobaculia bacterium]|nr:hypothetical protein [Thermoanaerobaculia bacterium]
MAASSKAGSAFAVLAALVLVTGAPLAASGVPLFHAADRCIACHTGLVTPAGEDVSIGSDHRASMMANAARDPYWQAAVRRETLDHPEAAAAIEHECAACHMPMARFEAKAAGALGEVFAHLPIGQGATRSDLLAADGVSCTLCHQIGSAGLGPRESCTAGFEIDASIPLGGSTERKVFGPFEVDPGRRALMGSASEFLPEEGRHVQSSELCATCHTLSTHALGPGGEAIGELPEQVPYLEWRHSSYAAERSCQSCHMPVVPEKVAVSSVLGVEREEVSRHVFRGGNAFMLRLLNRYRDELGVTALPQELETAAGRTQEHLETATARLAIEGLRVEDGRLEAEVVVTNLAGHKLPSAYPSRRAWLHVAVRDAAGRTVFESGAMAPDGSIRGNDNDSDPGRYEPHHRVVTDPDQVQIYEPILAGPDGEVTTGLLTAVRYAKDNRLLPRGFDKGTAPADVAVYGAAFEDPDFTGSSDRVRYRVAVPAGAGPFTVEAALRYQTIGFRWARNLAPVGAPETDRFVRYYDSMAETSAVTLARASAASR